MNTSFFSSSYEEARDRFIADATAAGATLSSYPLSIEGAAPAEYTIDVAVRGPEDAPALVVSSGVHGAEGFFGSAVQLAMLRQLQSENPTDIRWVFIHAINPYGFAQVRRFNEHNVDLNRNFLTDESQYSGAPDDYSRLNDFLNPASAPSRFEVFRIKAMWNIIRYGMGALKQSIAGGQYEYPNGIFFGGSGPSQSMEIIRTNFETWIGSAQKVVHVDFHTGLGPVGEYKLLLAELAGSDECQWYERVFGKDAVEGTRFAEGTAYKISGSLGGWLQNQFASRDYKFVTAEFGTVGLVRVLASVRAENRVHHYSTEASPAYQRAKKELLECFCPADPSWREKVVQSGVTVLRQAIDGLNVS